MVHLIGELSIVKIVVQFLESVMTSESFLLDGRPVGLRVAEFVIEVVCWLFISIFG